MTQEIQPHNRCTYCKISQEILDKVSKNLDGAYKINVLVWESHSRNPLLLICQTIFGVYMITKTETGFWYERVGSEFSGTCPALSEAKRACTVNFHDELKPILTPATLA